jgi:hypothetical protein
VNGPGSFLVQAAFGCMAPAFRSEPRKSAKKDFKEGEPQEAGVTANVVWQASGAPDRPESRIWPHTIFVPVPDSAMIEQRTRTESLSARAFFRQLRRAPRLVEHVIGDSVHCRSSRFKCHRPT